MDELERNDENSAQPALASDRIQQQRNLGEQHYQAGRLSEAEACFQEVLKSQPDNPNLWRLLGIVATQQQHYSSAIERLNRSIELDPNASKSYNTLGVIYLRQQKWLEAIDCFQSAIQLQPSDASAHAQLGNVYQLQGQSEAAIAAYQQALHLKPDLSPVRIKLGQIYIQQRKFPDAIASFQQVLQLQPDSHHVHYTLGNLYLQTDNLKEAVACYQRALQLQPDFYQACFNLGNAWKGLGMLAEAIACYERAFQIAPENSEVLEEYVWGLREICRWNGLSTLEQSLVAASQSDEWTAPPFPMLAIDDDPAVQLAAAQKFRARIIDPSISPQWHFKPRNQDRIRLAYLSADYHEHPTAYLMAELFELHDRSRFELYAISFGQSDCSPMRQRLERAFDRFIDVRQMDSREVANYLHSLEIDIAVDLKGYTKDCRPQILAYRPAPIQVNYLGYPGTMGAQFIDYILVDPFLVPSDQQPYFSEQLVHLPDCYQVNDSQRAIGDRPPSRQECGLPEKGFVFCCFNNSSKLSPSFFEVWMRLLEAIPGSVLWLLGRNQLMEANLRKEALARDVNPDRLIFAPLCQLPEHLARQRLADLFLDTSPCNAHTTASDALWAGLPVLTCAGRSFASRVAGSLLHAIGLPELVTHSLEEYEALALKLATQPDVLREIRDKLARNRAHKPLFDCDRFRRNIESAYIHMWSRWQQGEQPRGFTVFPYSETVQTQSVASKSGQPA